MTSGNLAAELRAESPDFIVLAPGYPRGTSTGGEFIRTRVQAYVAAGLSGHVYEYRAPSDAAPFTLHDGSTPITVTSADGIEALAPTLRELGVPVLAHSPTPRMAELLRTELCGSRVAVWYHGYEVRDYRRLMCNFSPTKIAGSRPGLDQMNRDRFAAARPIFEDPAITKVFVSQFQRGYSEFDVGATAENVHVIPNHIDTDLYRARERAPEEARRILLLRSFATRNYANDIALRALEILAPRRGFDQLEITVRGFGLHFQREVTGVRALRNVRVQEGYSSPVEMAMLHYDHGVFLCPTRFDTQGVMLGEAMASGMVGITNPVAAIPEFTDETCSLLPRGDDPLAFAEAIWHIFTHPELMPVMSRNAAARVEEQCGRAATVDREITIIRSLAA
ncbi:glycosyltransferase family 4 protein [Tessaracoccus rhinocerotis]|uniref:Glycosyltransferase family 4 protein n=1 Tax=Tessaracoccus rhinocerotis TaxID=1689449 RepID=A0A553JZB5_9ACTN|nr:glycosyltransferase family 4 protein [Tessaracoccus rhinocerotis]TRY17789.1 glycosyltransferase family 4 protein [Tessaracoccus rhinocerotis]